MSGRTVATELMPSVVWCYGESLATHAAMLEKLQTAIARRGQLVGDWRGPENLERERFFEEW